jgi:hypothetical protein
MLPAGARRQRFPWGRWGMFSRINELRLVRWPKGIPAPIPGALMKQLSPASIGKLLVRLSGDPSTTIQVQLWTDGAYYTCQMRALLMSMSM